VIVVCLSPGKNLFPPKSFKPVPVPKEVDGDYYLAIQHIVSLHACTPTTLGTNDDSLPPLDEGTNDMGAGVRR
jgi:hypothetical protein